MGNSTVGFNLHLKSADALLPNQCFLCIRDLKPINQHQSHRPPGLIDFFLSHPLLLIHASLSSFFDGTLKVRILSLTRSAFLYIPNIFLLCFDTSNSPVRRETLPSQTTCGQLIVGISLELVATLTQFFKRHGG